MYVNCNSLEMLFLGKILKFSFKVFSLLSSFLVENYGWNNSSQGNLFKLLFLFYLYHCLDLLRCFYSSSSSIFYKLLTVLPYLWSLPFCRKHHELQVYLKTWQHWLCKPIWKWLLLCSCKYRFSILFDLLLSLQKNVEIAL